jgi:hypothetical protein
LTVKNHSRDIERCPVRYASPFDKCRVETERGREFGRLRAAAMYQHDPDADLVQDANLLHERAGSAGVGEDFAALITNTLPLKSRM